MDTSKEKSSSQACTDNWSVISTKVKIGVIIISLTAIIIFSTLVGLVPFANGLALNVFLGTLILVLALGIKDSIKNKRGGLYLAPFQIQFLRVAVSLGAGQLVAFVLAMIDRLSNETPLPDEWFVIGSFIFAIPLLLNDGTPIKVPVNHCGVMTFFGRRLNWLFLVEGDYSWYGKKIFFNISQSPIIQPSTDIKNSFTTKGEKEGFPNLNRRTLSIWQDTVGKDPVLKLLSKTSTEVTTRLTIGIRTTDPMKWMLYNDPIAEICNRARASIRELVKNFIDVDVNPSESLIKSLLDGKKVFFAITLRPYELYREGSVVRDNGGVPISVVVGEDDKGKDIIDETDEDAEVRLLAKLKKANDELLEAATYKNKDGVIIKDSNDNPKINTYLLALKETIGDIAHSTGSELYMIAMSGTDVSAKVKEATQQLSAEANERESEKRTAESVKNIKDILGGNGDVALAIAANIAKVANVRAHAVSSGSKDMGSKVIAAATIIGEKGEGSN
ncbi:MAG: hypothetical protein KBC78_03550 [Candidatus Pacebacteria bacterium]|nr:hypothetical protein [Candidatus Paceibacterota bacterium]